MRRPWLRRRRPLLPRLLKLGYGTIWFGCPWPPGNEAWSSPTLAEVNSQLKLVLKEVVRLIRRDRIIANEEDENTLPHFKDVLYLFMNEEDENTLPHFKDVLYLLINGVCGYEGPVPAANKHRGPSTGR